MKPKIYIETTIVSYLTARTSSNVIIAAHQQITQDWWQTRRQDFILVASELVVGEANAGHVEMAQRRLDALREAELLRTTNDALILAKALVESGPLPEKAAEDALHIALAVTNGLDYLLTWNCKHIANAAMRNKIEEVCRLHGYEPIVICTPEELL